MIEEKEMIEEELLEEVINECWWCGCEFTSKYPDRAYCSEECEEANYIDCIL